MKTSTKELLSSFGGLVLMISIVLGLHASQNIAYGELYGGGLTGPAPVTMMSGNLYTGQAYTGSVPNNSRGKAFGFGKDNGYITSDTYASAGFNGTVTRGEVAKIIVSYYKNLVNEDIERSYRCNPKYYRDMASMDEATQSSVWDICSLGAMGWQNDKTHILWYFRPNATVTKGELSTVLSRLLYGTQSTGDVANRYADHMDVLEKQSVISDTKNPNAVQTRGDIYDMLMKVAQ